MCVGNCWVCLRVKKIGAISQMMIIPIKIIVSGYTRCHRIDARVYIQKSSDKIIPSTHKPPPSFFPPNQEHKTQIPPPSVLFVLFFNNEIIFFT